MVKRLFEYFLNIRTEEVVRRVLPYLNNSKRIVDIGSGTGLVAKLLSDKGLDVTAVDVVDFHGPRFIKPSLCQLESFGLAK